MRFYKLLFDEENSTDDELVACVEEDFENKYSIHKYSIYKGRKIENWDGELTFYFDPSEGDKPTDYLANDLGWPIVSDKIKQILVDLEVKNIQFLEVKIKNKQTMEQINGFSVVNVTKLIKGLCPEKSLLSKTSFGGVIKPVLKREAVINYALFRLEEAPYGLFVSEVVKREMENQNVTGCYFYEVRTV